METAAAIAGFIGLAGQCMQGCRFLHDFFTNVGEAPDVIRQLVLCLYQLLVLLDAFKTLLEDIRTSTNVPDLNGTASALCLSDLTISDLLDFVIKHSSLSLSKLKRKRWKRVWQNAKFAWNMKTLKAHKDKVHDAKTTLQIAQANLLLQVPISTANPLLMSSNISSSGVNISQNIVLQQMQRAIETRLDSQTAQVKSMLQTYMQQPEASIALRRRKPPKAIQAADTWTGDTCPQADLPAPTITSNKPGHSPSDTTNSQKPVARVVLDQKLLRAENLSKIGGIHIIWTDAVADHLHYEPRTRTLRLFTLPGQAKSDALPMLQVKPALVVEVMQSLQILFPGPRQEKGSIVGISHFAHDGYIRARLLALQDAMSNQTAETLKGLWNDRRSRTQWYTMWVAMSTMGLTVVLGISSFAIAVFQAYVAFGELQAARLG
jgi:uncharacterized protein YjlB